MRRMLKMEIANQIFAEYSFQMTIKRASTIKLYFSEIFKVWHDNSKIFWAYLTLTLLYYISSIWCCYKNWICLQIWLVQLDVARGPVAILARWQSENRFFFNTKSIIIQSSKAMLDRTKALLWSFKFITYASQFYLNHP